MDFEERLERAMGTRGTHPYLLLERGPTEHACPIHGLDEGLLLPVEHEYWRRLPLRSVPECKCLMRQVSRRESERLIKDGVRDPDAPPIRDERGLLTGRKEDRRIPVKLSPSC